MRVKHLNREQSKIGESGRPINITFTGPLILSSDPLENTDAATKRYVDTVFLSLDASNLKSGILPVGRLPAFNGDVTNVAGSNVFTLNPSGVNAGTYAKVTVDSKGRVIGHSPLVASDIPSLDWGKITKNKPTTLEGYGITDGINLSGDSVVGTVRSTATPVNPGHAVTRKYIEDTAFGEGSLIPAGIVVKYATNITPNGFLRCNGGEVDKTMYYGLYATIGDRFSYESYPGAGQPWTQQYGINKSTDLPGAVSTRHINAIPLGTSFVSVLVTKNRVYLFGGYGNSTGRNYIQSAAIDNNGIIGTWSNIGSLPNMHYMGGCFVVKNKVYLVGPGGLMASSINQDGTLGSWVSLSELLPVGEILNQLQILVSENKVYMFTGKLVRSNSETSKIYVSNILENGDLSPFVIHVDVTNQFSAYGVQYCKLAVVKNYIYLFASNYGFTFRMEYDGKTLGTTVTTVPLSRTTNTNVFRPLVVTSDRIYDFRTTDQRRASYYIEVNQDGTLGNTVLLNTNFMAATDGVLMLTSSKLYFLVGGLYTRDAYSIDFLGGLNDYSEFYKSNLTVTDSTKFRLPDFTPKDTLEERHYIKY